MKIKIHQDDLPSSLKFGKSIAIDTEAMGLNHQRDRVCLVQLSNGNGICHLLKINSDNNQRKAVPDSDGKRAITEFNLMEEFDNCALFQIKPITGKTHQIRVHANFIGKPLAGDQRYNPEPDFLENFGLKRLFLHAKLISFPLPNAAEKIISIESNIGNELNDVISKLRT